MRALVEPQHDRGPHTRSPQTLSSVCQRVCLVDMPRIIEESQPVKNRKLSRLLAKLSRLHWSSQRNCVYYLSPVFTLLQQQEVPSTCQPRDLPYLVFEASNTFLTYP